MTIPPAEPYDPEDLAADLLTGNGRAANEPPRDSLAADSDDEYGLAPESSSPPVAFQRPAPPPLRSLAEATWQPDSALAPGELRDRQRNRTPTSATSARTARASRPLIRPNQAARSQSGVLYWLFAAALIPLAISLLTEVDDTEARLANTLKAHPEVVSQLQVADEVTKESLLAQLPNGRISGAHLSYDSWAHWFYALAAAAILIGAVVLLFPLGQAKLREMLLVTVGVATVGILFLLAVQRIALSTQGVVFVGRPIAMLIFYVIKFIGFSYCAAMDENTGFALSFLGFTMGVGLCEELTKALPVLLRFRAKPGLDWRGACVWGLASGIGFGVAEGIIYSAQFYNGVASFSAYPIRFISCVALHAVWAATVALMIYRRREWVQAEWSWGEGIVTVLWVLAVPMVLHGLYDTLLKKEMHGLALCVAVMSFLWLVLFVEQTRSRDDDDAEFATA